MTERYHYFSHIEDLETGSLVFDDPFTMGLQQKAWVCRYETHRAGRRCVEEDSCLSGIQAWHAVLPVPREAGLPSEAVVTLQPAKLAAATEVASLHRVIPFRGLADLIPEVLAKQRTAPLEASTNQVWANPYRIEGLKLIALCLANRFSNMPPVLVLDDPSGELVFAVAMARQLLRDAGQAHPFRVILLQEKPHHQLCLHFEGAPVNWDDRAPRPPGPIPQIISNLLTDSMGTAVVMEGHSCRNAIFETALRLLLRTGFVDDEDHVLLID